MNVHLKRARRHFNTFLARAQRLIFGPASTDAHPNPHYTGQPDPFQPDQNPWSFPRQVERCCLCDTEVFSWVEPVWSKHPVCLTCFSRGKPHQTL